MSETDSSSDDFDGIPEEFRKRTIQVYPEPSPLKISVMATIGTIFCKERNWTRTGRVEHKLLVNLDNLYDELTIDDTLISIKYDSKPIKGWQKTYKKRRKKCEKPKKKYRKQYKKKTFYNQMTLIFQLSETCRINMKFFLNGGYQMTGVKGEEYVEQALQYLFRKLRKIKKKRTVMRNAYPTRFANYLVTHKKCNKKILDTIFSYNHKIKFDVRNQRTILINSDFKTGFKINRPVLNNLLGTDYQILTTFDPCYYPAVNSKYYWNESYMSSDYIEGKCYCQKKDKCTGKGTGKGVGQCKRITIATFQSGSVIITGAQKREQLDVCYRYINKVFRDNFLNLQNI
tara:strand:- start:2134 stop:3162 length:1029 start_codon:yes stop_codon:yes gene_type:complete